MFGAAWRDLIDPQEPSTAQRSDHPSTAMLKFGLSAANITIHRHCMRLGGVCRHGTEGAPELVECSTE
jgi:hypothetical protein